MSFTCGSGKGRVCRDYVFADSTDCHAEEFETLRSDRFQRRSKKAAGRLSTEDVVLGCGRGNETGCASVDPVMLGSIDSKNTKLFYNLEAYPYAFETDRDLVNWVCAVAEESPTARALFSLASKEGWSIGIENLSQSGYALDEDARRLTLDHYGFAAHALGRSAHYRHAVLLSFIKALRHIWHIHIRPDVYETHRPDSIFLLERAMAADIQTIAILAGWELRAAGYAEIWRYILGSDEGDMAMIFTRAMEKDPAGFYDGSVLTRTFCQWYGDETRVAETDHATLETMDDLLDDNAEGMVFGKTPVSDADIEVLSALPASMTYLKGMGRNILSDPYFVSMNDPINEAHLFQVAYDSRVVMVEGVPFRDHKLARLIFPGGKVKVRD